MARHRPVDVFQDFLQAAAEALKHRLHCSLKIFAGVLAL